MSEKLSCSGIELNRFKLMALPDCLSPVGVGICKWLLTSKSTEVVAALEVHFENENSAAN